MNYSKDGVTVAAMFDTAHPKKSGKCPVKIRVTYNRVRNYYPTGKDLSPEEWEILPTTKVRALVAIRKDIESSYQIVRTAVEELAGAGGFSLDALNNRLKGAASDTVNTMFRAKIAELEKAGRVGNMLIYDNVLKGLERFAGMRIRFDVIGSSPCRAGILSGHFSAGTPLAVNPAKTKKARLNSRTSMVSTQYVKVRSRQQRKCPA